MIVKISLPKLNFSARHDAWLKDYSHMLATPIYRKVCCDLIDEVCELFDNPRLFHLGFDEENGDMLRYLSFEAIRSGDLLWNDFYTMFDRVEKNGARPWVWADMVWNHPEEYYARMPKSVLQSNWYYQPLNKLPDGRYDDVGVNAYLDLDAAGYDQVPSCSSWAKPYNMMSGSKAHIAQLAAAIVGLGPVKLLGSADFRHPQSV